MKKCIIPHCNNYQNILKRNICYKHYKRSNLCNDLAKVQDEKRWDRKGRTHTPEDRLKISKKLRGLKKGPSKTPELTTIKRKLASFGPRSASWKGGRRLCKKYWNIWSPLHPFCDKNKLVPEHRLILEKHYSEKFGIPIFILPYFDVHHKNGNKTDNRPENLEMIHRREHMREHRTNNRERHTCSNPNCLDPNTTYVYRYEVWRVSKISGKILCTTCFYKELSILKSNSMGAVS